MPNPNCPECHGTGYYKGSLFGGSEPCSICQPATLDGVPLDADGVPRVEFKFEITPGGLPGIALKMPRPTANPDFPHLLRGTWLASWEEIMGQRGKIITLGSPSDRPNFAINAYDYRAFLYHVCFDKHVMHRLSVDDLIHSVRNAAHGAYPTAVWRIVSTPNYMRQMTPYHKPNRSDEVSETVFICPDVDIKSDGSVRLYYYANWTPYR